MYVDLLLFSVRFYITNYRISSYSFRGNYSFLDLEIQRSQYIRPKVTVHKGVETIQGQKLYELLWGTIRYSKYGMFFATFHHILFWKVRSWSVRTGPENFGGPVRSWRNDLTSVDWTGKEITCLNRLQWTDYFSQFFLFRNWENLNCYLLNYLS